MMPLGDDDDGNLWVYFQIGTSSWVRCQVLTMSLRKDKLTLERLELRIQNLLELALRNTIYVA